MRTAQGAFLSHREAIRCQLQTLDKLMEVEYHYSPEEVSWAHVGDLTHVEESLQNVIEFMMNQDLDDGLDDSEPNDFYDEHEHNYQAEVGRGLRLHQRRQL